VKGRIAAAVLTPIRLLLISIVDFFVRRVLSEIGNGDTPSKELACALK
jgi:hypothetical protein